MIAATYMNWWPARPLAAAAIARHVSFQLELAWNFLEAHHESNVKVKQFSIFWRRVYARVRKTRKELVYASPGVPHLTHKRMDRDEDVLT